MYTRMSGRLSYECSNRGKISRQKWQLLQPHVFIWISWLCEYMEQLLPSPSRSGAALLHFCTSWDEDILTSEPSCPFFCTFWGITQGVVARESCAVLWVQSCSPAWISWASWLPLPVKGRKLSLPWCFPGLCRFIGVSGDGVCLEVCLNISSCVQWKLGTWIIKASGWVGTEVHLQKLLQLS